jgi:hypothetical protein
LFQIWTRLPPHGRQNLKKCEITLHCTAISGFGGFCYPVQKPEKT